MSSSRLTRPLKILRRPRRYRLRPTGSTACWEDFGSSASISLITWRIHELVNHVDLLISRMAMATIDVLSVEKKKSDSSHDVADCYDICSALTLVPP